MIRAVFLDIDNTLLSFSGYVKQAMREGFAAFGLPEYREEMYPVFQRVNDGLWQQIEQGTLTFERLQEIRWNLIFEQLGIRFDGPTFETYFREKLFDSAVPEPGAGELLAYLRERYVLCAASNGPYGQQLNRLRIAGFYDAFRYFFISEKIGASKPGADFFDACFDTLRAEALPGLKAEETMMIGDSVSAEISGAKQYGMAACLYTGGRAVGQTGGADYAVSRLEEIRAFL